MTWINEPSECAANPEEDRPCHLSLPIGTFCYHFRMDAPTRLDLQRFLPYRLAVLASAVSHSVAAVYAERFELSREQWRVLAALAQGDGVNATDIGAVTTLDKMAVSRAVAGLEARGLLRREIDADDRRHRILRLTAGGRAMFRKIAPMAQARETFLLEALDDDERRVLDRAIDKLTAQARRLQAQG